MEKEPVIIRVCAVPVTGSAKLKINTIKNRVYNFIVGHSIEKRLI
tara:strand:- start:183 stop:317 length:135 start_codon:yes stop_codon:yes gene_type:complete